MKQEKQHGPVSDDIEAATAALRQSLRRARRIVRETGEALKEQQEKLDQISAD